MYQRNYPDPDMALIQRALLSDHQRQMRRKRLRAIVSDVIVVMAAPALLALFLYAGEILIALGVM